jgi:peptide/nickel transport system permease protein
MRGPLVALRRAAASLAVVFASSLVFGALCWMAPGGPRSGGRGYVEFIGGFWWGALRGDLGASFRGQPIVGLVWTGLGNSLPLVLGALGLSATLALALGWLTSGPRGAGREPLLAIVELVSWSPVFLLGYLAVVLLAVPPDGPARTLAAICILAVGDGTLADLSLALRGELLRLRRADFVQFQRLRGIPLWRSLPRHLLLPLSRLLAARMSWLLGGVLVLENVLGIQGVGLLGYRAAQHGDFMLLLGIAVLAAAIVETARLAADLAARLDPRSLA